MLNECERQFQNDRPHPIVEDRKLRTYRDDEMSLDQIQQIFGNLPKPDAAPQGWASIEPDDEPTQPMEPLPWLDVEIIDLRQNINRLETRIDRDLATLQQNIEVLGHKIDFIRADLERDVAATSSVCDGIRSFALLLFGFATAMFVAGSVSGSAEQKDALAENGVNLAVIGIVATAIGCTISRAED